MIEKVECRIDKIWVREVLSKLYFMPWKLLKRNSMLHTTSRGKWKGMVISIRSAETFIQWHKLRRTQIKQCCKRDHRASQEHSRVSPPVVLGLIDNHSSKWDLRYATTKVLVPDHYQPSKIYSWFQGSSSVSLSEYQALSESSQGLAPSLLLLAVPTKFLLLAWGPTWKICLIRPVLNTKVFFFSNNCHEVSYCPSGKIRLFSRRNLELYSKSDLIVGCDLVMPQ